MKNILKALAVAILVACAGVYAAIELGQTQIQKRERAKTSRGLGLWEGTQARVIDQIPQENIAYRVDGKVPGGRTIVLKLTNVRGGKQHHVTLLYDDGGHMMTPHFTPGAGKDQIIIFENVSKTDGIRVQPRIVVQRKTVMRIAKGVTRVSIETTRDVYSHSLEPGEENIEIIIDEEANIFMRLTGRVG